MSTPSISGYEPCYLVRRRRVGQRSFRGQTMPEPEVSSQKAAPQTTWLAWGRSVSALIVVAVLLALGVANIALRSRWHDVEDGVLWGTRAEGLTALEVADPSSGAAAGIQRGDILVAIDRSPVQSPDDVVQYQHRSRHGTHLAYTLLRLGTRQALE